MNLLGFFPPLLIRRSPLYITHNNPFPLRCNQPSPSLASACLFCLFSPLLNFEVIKSNNVWQDFCAFLVLGNLFPPQPPPQVRNLLPPVFSHSLQSFNFTSLVYLESHFEGGGRGKADFALFFSVGQTRGSRLPHRLMAPRYHKLLSSLCHCLLTSP